PRGRSIVRRAPPRPAFDGAGWRRSSLDRGAGDKDRESDDGERFGEWLCREDGEALPLWEKVVNAIRAYMVVKAEGKFDGSQEIGRFDGIALGEASQIGREWRSTGPKFSVPAESHLSRVEVPAGGGTNPSAMSGQGSSGFLFREGSAAHGDIRMVAMVCFASNSSSTLGQLDELRESGTGFGSSRFGTAAKKGLRHGANIPILTT
ncbi:hypothetical protein HDZ31DRAFT_78982, partial [Schizophyllum fasciatum]